MNDIEAISRQRCQHSRFVSAVTAASPPPQRIEINGGGEYWTGQRLAGGARRCPKTAGGGRRRPKATGFERSQFRRGKDIPRVVQTSSLPKNLRSAFALSTRNPTKYIVDRE